MFSYGIFGIIGEVFGVDRGIGEKEFWENRKFFSTFKVRYD